MIIWCNLWCNHWYFGGTIWFEAADRAAPWGTGCTAASMVRLWGRGGRESTGKSREVWRGLQEMPTANDLCHVMDSIVMFQAVRASHGLSFTDFPDPAHLRTWLQDTDQDTSGIAFRKVCLVFNGSSRGPPRSLSHHDCPINPCYLQQQAEAGFLGS